MFVFMVFVFIVTVNGVAEETLDMNEKSSISPDGQSVPVIF